MKNYMIAALALFSAQLMAWECSNSQYHATGKIIETKFSMTALHGQLVKTCHPPHHTSDSCAFSQYDAVYSITVREESPRVLDLTKISGDGPEQLVWKEKAQWIPPASPRADDYPRAGYTRKYGEVTAGDTYICSKGI